MNWWIAGIVGSLCGLGSAQGEALTAHEINQAAAHFAHKSFFPQPTRVAALAPPTVECPFWVAQLAPAGFLLLNPDSTSAPILSFSTAGTFDSEAEPAQILRQALTRRQQAAQPDPQAPELWRQLLAGPEKQTAADPGEIVVAPLLATHWSQWSPFNATCPAATNAPYGYGDRVPTGCVPVAISQLMRFYSWPASGVGTETWHDTNGAIQGTFTADWNSAMDWMDMKDTYAIDCDDPAVPASPLSALIARLGAGAEMDYEANGSSSDVMVLGRSLQAHLGYALGGLTAAGAKNFGLILEQQINARYPVLINLPYNGTGHTAVGDGLAKDGATKYVHLNYGFGGMSDGWLAYGDASETNTFTAVVDTLRPSAGGILVACAPNFLEVVATNGAAADQTLRVIGSGGPLVNYTLACTNAWVQISPAANSPGSQEMTHTVKFDLTGLEKGAHEAYIVVKGAAANLPRTVRVRLYIPNPPQIAVQPEDKYTTAPTNILLTVTAQGGETGSPCLADATLGYQWYRDGQPLDGAVNYWCHPTGYGAYQCAVTGLGGTQLTRVATVATPKAGSQLSVTGFSGGKMTVRIENIQNATATLQSSSNLDSWQDVKTFAVTPGAIVQFQIGVSSSDPTRYYRIKE